MRKYILLIFLGIASMAHAGIKESITSIWKVYQDYIIGTMGHESLKPEHEKFIRSIITELGMDQSLVIRKMNQASVARFGRNNAFVVPFGNCMFVSEDFFDELTPDERRFLIGHELMHIKKKHVYKKVGYGLVLITAYYGYVRSRLIGLLNQKLISYNFQKDSRSIFTGLTDRLVIRLLFPFGMLAVSRAHEREADRESALQLGKSAARGGVKLWKRLQAKDPHEHTFLRTLISTHPSHVERIKILEDLDTRRSVSAAA